MACLLDAPESDAAAQQQEGILHKFPSSSNGSNVLSNKIVAAQYQIWDVSTGAW